MDTLLMCTAAIVYDGDTPVSPRKQGAGLMDINAAAGTPAYITVAAWSGSKLELKDDPQRRRRYNLDLYGAHHGCGSRPTRLVPCDYRTIPPPTPMPAGSL
ncbi:MAG: hypothetical protein ACLSHU_07610 [Oscillospiraceae bacterium]